MFQTYSRENILNNLVYTFLIKVWHSRQCSNGRYRRFCSPSPSHFKTDLVFSSMLCADFWQFLWSFCLYGYFTLLVFLRLVNLTAEQQRTCEIKQGRLILRERTNKQTKVLITLTFNSIKKPSKCHVMR